MKIKMGKFGFGAMVLIIAALMLVVPVIAAAVDVNDEASLRAAVAAGPPVTINLTNDITLTESALEIINGADITLTGPYSIVQNAATRTITVRDGGKLTIDGVTVTHLSGVIGAGVVVESGGTLIMTSGSIADNTSNTDGGGIFNQGIVTLLGGEVIDNISPTYGGGIANWGGTVTIDGASILFNEAGENGGGIDNHAGTLNVSTGTIASNTAYNGGGISNDAILNETGGTIRGNIATNAGGGIYHTGTSLTLNSATISYNKAENGGGLYFDQATASFTFNGDTFLGNEAVERGGGMYANAAAVTFSGGTLEGNTAKYGGGIYYTGTQGGKLTLELDTITGNTATGTLASEGFGGGIYTAASVDVINTVFFANNANYGGGLFIANNNNVIADIKSGSFIKNAALTNGGAIWIDYLELANLTVAAGIEFSDNRAAVAYDRNPVDDATYAAHIFATTWSWPLPQGYNNWDISYTNGDPVPFYSVTFDPGAHGAFSAVTYSDIMRGDWTPEPPVPTARPGWKFVGWKPVISDTVTGDVTYVAQWEAVATVPPTGDALSLWAPLVLTILGALCVRDSGRRKP